MTDRRTFGTMDGQRESQGGGRTDETSPRVESPRLKVRHEYFTPMKKESEEGWPKSNPTRMTKSNL